MSKALTFNISFKGPFLIGGAAPGDGFNARPDTDVLIPATSIKGRLRAEATHVLGINEELVDDIFGTADNDGKWWFSDVDVDDPVFEIGNRVALDKDNPESGRADDHQLVFFQHCWADTGKFTIEPLVTIAPEEQQKHEAVLEAAARSVTNLGGMRRRGHGWVEILRAGAGDSDDALIKLVMELQK